MIQQRPHHVATGVALVASSLLACGDAGGGDEAAAVPAGRVRSGSSTTCTIATPAAVLAFVHGLHVALLDGDRLYAAMIRRDGPKGANGERTALRRQPERPSAR